MSTNNREIYIFISGDTKEIKKMLKFLGERYKFVSQSIHPSPATPECTKGYLSVIKTPEELDNPF